jgi:hypothetical protein
MFEQKLDFPKLAREINVQPPCKRQHKGHDMRADSFICLLHILGNCVMIKIMRYMILQVKTLNDIEFTLMLVSLERINS